MSMMEPMLLALAASEDSFAHATMERAGRADVLKSRFLEELSPTEMAAFHHGFSLGIVYVMDRIDRSDDAELIEDIRQLAHQFRERERETRAGLRDFVIRDAQ